MARRAKGSGFKMRSGNSPLKQNNEARSMKRNQLSTDINAFLSGLGQSISGAASKLGIKKTTPDPTAYRENMARRYGTGDFAASGSRSKERMRPGESQFQYDVRMKKLKRKAEKVVKKQNQQGTEIKLDKTTPSYTYEYGSTTKPSSNIEKTKTTKFSGKKPTAAVGSEARKKQYDALGWKYDHTIKGYNRDGSSKGNFVVQTSVDEVDGVMTPKTQSFATKEEANAFIAKNKGSFGYKTDKGGKRIEGSSTSSFKKRKKSSTKKKSGVKMKKSPAKKYKKK